MPLTLQQAGGPRGNFRKSVALTEDQMSLETDARARLQLRSPIALPGAAHKVEMGVHFTVALVANKHDAQETPSQRFETVLFSTIRWE